MIIATGSVDINEATKLAQNASDSASDLAEKIKNLKTSLDGTITESPNTPFDDGKEHNDGDMWLVMSGDVATSMYIYSGGSWALKKWDVTSLAVEYLSALSANLGNVQAGNINGVNISGSTINGGSIAIDSGIDKFTMNNSGFEASNLIDGDTTDVYGGMITLNEGNSGVITLSVSSGIDSSSSRIYTNGMTMSAGSVFGVASGDLYFETGYGSSGSGGAGLHAASFNKMSQLSVKRNLSDVPGDYALAQISGTDVKRYEYKDSDNSQQTNIGPVIDDVNQNGDKAYNISSDLINKKSDGISVDNEVGLLMAAVKELTKRNSELTMRISKLERKMQ